MNVGFGVRLFLALLAVALRAYNRHRETIDAALPEPLETAVRTLADALEEITDINKPGPQ